MTYGAVQLLRNALAGGGGLSHGVAGPPSEPSPSPQGGGGSAERYVTPKIIYMNNIYYNFYCYVCLF